MSESELKARIDFLKHGRWSERGQLAWEVIGKRPAAGSRSEVKSQRELKTLLRAHWKDAIYESEGKIRDSFDEALTLYQLYELAIETGYLPLDEVRQSIHGELSQLLWSEGARRYLKYYSYTSVAFLAKRVGVDLGFKEITVPRVRNQTEGRFASFLSQHVLWYSDDILDGWLGFLDDYLVIGDLNDADKEIFESFLNSSTKKFEEEAALWDFVAGADRLITRLAEVADMLSDDDKPYYGMFYAYWMAKMYGYDLGDDGFLRDKEQIDWSEQLVRSKRIRHQLNRASEELKKNKSNEVPENLLDLFVAKDKIVRNFWDVTRKQFETDPIQFR